MEPFHFRNSKPLYLMSIKEIISLNKKLALSENSIHRIEKCRVYLDHKTKSISL